MTKKCENCLIVDFDSSKEASWRTDRNSKQSSLLSTISEFFWKNFQKLHFFQKLLFLGYPVSPGPKERDYSALLAWRKRIVDTMLRQGNVFTFHFLKASKQGRVVPLLWLKGYRAPQYQAHSVLQCPLSLLSAQTTWPFRDQACIKVGSMHELYQFSKSFLQQSCTVPNIPFVDG